MQKPNRLRDRNVVIFLAGLIGVLAFVLCLAFACAMLFLHGNPTLLFSCLLAGTATFAFARFNLRWFGTIDRMRTMEGTRVGRRYRDRQGVEVEDVVFREMPAESFTPPQTRQG